MSAVSNAPRPRLPWGGLLALSASGFLAIFTETIPAGLLPELSRGLGVTESAAGQLVTLYAMGSVVAAIPLVAATQTVNRKKVLLAAVATLGAFNLVTAAAPWLPVILAARFVAGAAAALVWGVLAGFARSLVAPQLQGRALAVTGLGQPIALAGGVPLGSFAASVMDWRWVFVAISVAAGGLAVWIAAAVQNVEGSPRRQREPLRRVVMLPGVRLIFAVTGCWILAHNMLYTYAAPLLNRTDLRLDVGLGLFGVASMIGISLVGMVIDRALRLVSAICVTAMCLATTVWLLPQVGIALALASVIAWGLSFGGAPVLLQTALADRAGEHTDAAQSVFVTVFNLAVAGGGFMGGMLLASSGTAGIATTSAVLCLVAVGMVVLARAAFPAGHRHKDETDKSVVAPSECSA